MAGIFITFEGGDGCGKTTQVDAIIAALQTAGHTITQTREPGGTPAGVAIREILLHSTSPLDPKAEALLFAADRAHHVATVVRPALERGEIVIQDRYIDSSVAYQGAGRGIDGAEIRQLSEWASTNLWPDLTVLLDLDPATAAERVNAQKKQFDRIEAEKHDFRARLRDQFLTIADAEPERFLVVDATQPAKTITADIAARVFQLILARSAAAAGAERP